MAVTLKTNGSQACTVGTDHTLATITDAGVYSLEVTIPAAATFADVFEFWAVTKIGAGGDTAYARQRVTVRGRGAAFNLPPLAPLESVASVAFVVNQSAGTSRTVAWAVKAVG
jgi:hypothetical protein